MDSLIKYSVFYAVSAIQRKIYQKRNSSLSIPIPLRFIFEHKLLGVTTTSSTLHALSFYRDNPLQISDLVEESSGYTTITGNCFWHT